MYDNTAIVCSNNLSKITVTTNNICNVKYNLDGSIKRTHTNKKSGISSEVYAFNSEADIENMIAVFDKHIRTAKDKNKLWIAHRNKLLFLLGINIGIRASDLRNLHYDYFLNDDGSFKDCYAIMPKKTANKRKFVKLFFNDVVRQAVLEYINIYPFKNLDDFIFPSRKGNDSITEATIWKIINDTAIEAGIKQNIGSHSLRKTFGYWAWHNATDKNQALIILQAIFNHSSPATTAKYIGITDYEMEDMYNNVALGKEYISF